MSRRTNINTDLSEVQRTLSCLNYAYCELYELQLVQRPFLASNLGANILGKQGTGPCKRIAVLQLCVNVIQA